MTSCRANREMQRREMWQFSALTWGKITHEHCIHSKGVTLQQSHLTEYFGQNSYASVIDPSRYRISMFANQSGFYRIKKISAFDLYNINTRQFSNVYARNKDLYIYVYIQYVTYYLKILSYNHIPIESRNTNIKILREIVDLTLH